MPDTVGKQRAETADATADSNRFVRCGCAAVVLTGEEFGTFLASETNTPRTPNVARVLTHGWPWCVGKTDNPRVNTRATAPCPMRRPSNPPESQPIPSVTLPAGASSKTGSRGGVRKPGPRPENLKLADTGTPVTLRHDCSSRYGCWPRPPTANSPGWASTSRPSTASSGTGCPPASP